VYSGGDVAVESVFVIKRSRVWPCLWVGNVTCCFKLYDCNVLRKNWEDGEEMSSM